MNKVLVFVFLVFMGCSSDNKRLVKKAYVDQPELDLLDGLNNLRNRYGLEDIIIDTLSTHIALKHNDYMIREKRVSHDLFLSRKSFIFKERDGTDVEEIVAKGYESSQDVLDAWLHNPINFKAIIGDYKYVVISIKEKHYTVIFYNKLLIL